MLSDVKTTVAELLPPWKSLMLMDATVAMLEAVTMNFLVPSQPSELVTVTV
ncbi:hypothetical protein D9M72_468800 [compost metagenome]